MVIIKINIAQLYTQLAGNKIKMGFIAHPITLSDGTKIVGLYRGFGSKGVLCTYTPKQGQKGFRNLGPIEGNPDGDVYIRD